jgi:hypothetical protein
VCSTEAGLHFKKTHDVANVPTAAGAYRPDAFTESGTGEQIQWGVHIGKRKGFLPFIERFDLTTGKPYLLLRYETIRALYSRQSKHLLSVSVTFLPGGAGFPISVF